MTRSCFNNHKDSTTSRTEGRDLARVLVVGNFGEKKNILTGQTVKTRAVYSLISKYLSPSKFDKFNTEDLRNPLKWFTLLRKLFHCRRLIYMPAYGNLKFLLPVYFLLSLIGRFDIIYIVIGGWLPDYIRHKPLHRFILRRIRVIMAETVAMKKALERDYGFTNVKLLYNFRDRNESYDVLHDNKPAEPVLSKGETPGKLKIVYLGRVMRQKGIDIIFDMAERLREKPLSAEGKNIDVTIDVYGQVNKEYKVDFDRRLTELSAGDHTGCKIVYKGDIEPQEVIETLAAYDLMLFPTLFTSVEGIPGSLVESLMAGVPVICREWIHANEVITHGSNGIVVTEPGDAAAFVDAIKDVVRTSGSLERMRKSALESSHRFSSELAWEALSKELHISEELHPDEWKVNAETIKQISGAETASFAADPINIDQLDESRMVSVIMPAYNSARYIAESIESVLAQTYRNLELLIVDDGSSDNTGSIAMHYAAADPRIKVIRLLDNNGPGVARNVAILRSRGRWIAFCDSDDRWLPNKLEKQINLMVNKGVTMCYSSYYTCNERGEPTGGIRCKEHQSMVTIVRDCGVGCLTTIYDTRRYGKRLMPAVRKRQDWCLWIDLIEESNRNEVYGITEPLAIYRRRRHSLSSAKFTLLKYNFNVYRHHLGYSYVSSLMLLCGYFLPHYFYKVISNKLNPPR